MNSQIFNVSRFSLVALIFCAMTITFIFPVKSFPAAQAFEQNKTLNAPSAQINPQLEKTPVAFEANRGQFDSRVRFAARAAGSTIFLTATETVYVLPMASSKSQVSSFNSDKLLIEEQKTTNEEEFFFALRMKLVGANADSNFTGEQIQEHRTNYFKGADESKWQPNVPNFGRVRYENIYDGVSLVWHGRENGATQYDFVVEPNADAEQINLEFDGADNLEIDADGNLLIHTPAGTLKQGKPFSYQETDGVKREIESRFIIGQSKIKFVLGDYDRSKSLTIDPTVTLGNLAFSTFLGGGGNDTGNSIAVDAAGNSYVAGQTTSIQFPATVGMLRGTSDAFVAKLNASGTALIYSTFLGGIGSENALDLSLDAAGSVYVTGYTSSSDFPTNGLAYDTTYNGGFDVFATKLTADGSGLTYSTFVGGNGSDLSNSIALDAAGNAYITGQTSNANYPTTAGAYDTTFGGGGDVFVTKFNAAGSDLTYSTFVGGTNFEIGYAVALDSADNAYITGYTSSSDYPTTANSYDTSYNGGANSDAYITKINAAGSNLIYSTFLGGSNDEYGKGVAVDFSGNAYIVGYTDSTNYPTTFGAFDQSHNGGGNDIFFTKLNLNNPGNSAFLVSTFVGGSGNELAAGIAVDAAGNTCIVGYTNSADFPVSPDVFDATITNTDSEVVVIKTSGTSLIYSTYIGGSVNDSGLAIAVDGFGNLYATGNSQGGNPRYPTTENALQTFHAGGNDVFVSKLGDFVISGRAIDQTGAPLANVMIAMSGQVSGNMITGADGRFAFFDTATNQPHTITATRSGYSINPSLFNIANLNNNRDLVFVGTVGSPTGGGGGGTVRFANLSYTKGENGASVTATVERTGQITTNEPVTVDFQTANGTAIAGADYAAQSGVLTFNNPFENSKTITVPLVNDTRLEPRENFRIVLSNPTNNADVDPNRASVNIQILDEDLSNGDLLISEFRERGRLGANDEYVKIYNPNPFDITVFAADESSGLTLARANGMDVTSILTIPNYATIAARGHYLLTNNNSSGGFSLIDYPTGTGTTTAVGDRTFSADIPDNSNLALLKTANRRAFNSENLIDAVGFGNASWTTEGGALPAIGTENSETCFVRKLSADGLQDTNDNRADFLLIDNHARAFAGAGQTKIYSALGAPAPETSESLRLMTTAEIGMTDFETATGTEVYNPTPVPNGAQGTLTLYRRITNRTNAPLTKLRLRVTDFPTAGSASQPRYSSRPDFRILSSADEGGFIKGLTLAAERLQPNGGGINSTLTVEAINQNNPLGAGESVVVAVRLGVMRYGRHPFAAAVEALQ